MLVFNKIKPLKQKLKSLNKKISVGFVPTMGALHEGHLSLIKQAKKENDTVVVSVFVNPTQFDRKEDLLKYPMPINKDLSLLEITNCDIVFNPSAEEIYKNNINSHKFNFDGLENQMEGKFRDGHFDGVGTIVKLLFEIVEPHKAYFGEKDFQQLQIIRKLVEKCNFDIEIIGCPIYREKDGLAMSSRNVRLTKEHRIVAPFIYKALKWAKISFGTKNVVEITDWVLKEFEKQPLLNLEYFEIVEEKSLQLKNNIDPEKKYRAFIAVFAGKIRLIDNISL